MRSTHICFAECLFSWSAVYSRLSTLSAWVPIMSCIINVIPAFGFKKNLILCRNLWYFSDKRTQFDTKTDVIWISWNFSSLRLGVILQVIFLTLSFRLITQGFQCYCLAVRCISIYWFCVRKSLNSLSNTGCVQDHWWNHLTLITILWTTSLCSCFQEGKLL